MADRSSAQVKLSAGQFWRPLACAENKAEMSTVILAPDETVAHLRRQLPAGFVPKVVLIEDALRFLTSGEHGRFVFDPRELRESEFARIRAAIVGARIDILLYTLPGGLKRAISIEPAYPIELLLIGSESERDLLPTLLLAGTEPSVPAMVSQRLAPRLRTLSIDLQAAIHGLFGGAEIPRRVGGFAQRVGRSDVTVNRWLSKASVAPVRDFLIGADVCRLYQRLDDSDDSVDTVLERFGRLHSRGLQAAFRDFAGLPPRRAVAELLPDEFAARVASRLTVGRDEVSRPEPAGSE